MMVSPEAQELLVQVAANVRRGRERLGLTQENLAERGGFNYRFYRSLEAGKVDLSVSTLYRLAQALGVRPAQLLRRTKPIPPRPGRPPKKRTRPSLGRKAR